MINKMLVLIISLFLSSITLAQTANYIEVTVNDTVLVQPDQFVYRLIFSPDINTMIIDTAAAKLPNYYIKRAEEIKEKQKQLKEEWQNKIKNAGFTIMLQNLNEAFIKNSYDNNISVQILINSIDSLIKFFSLIKNEKSLIGNLQSVKTKNEDFYYNNLYKKLLEKARRRADYIAVSIGKKVSGINSISENRNYFSGWNAYPQNYIFPPPQSASDNKTFIAAYQIQSNLTVRFLVR